MLPLYGATHDLRGKVKVPGHPLHDEELLEVLAAENGDVGLDDVEELAYDGGDPAEEVGPRQTAKRLLEVVRQDLPVLVALFPDERTVLGGRLVRRGGESQRVPKRASSPSGPPTSRIARR